MKGSNRPPAIAVVNAGTHPELIHLAVGLTAAGVDVVYISASMVPNRSRWVRHVARGRLQQDLDARTLPAELRHAVTYGLAFEFLFVVASKLSLSNSVSALRWRNQYFEYRSSRALRNSGVQVVIAQQTVAKQVFAASSPALKILNYPIAHHKWAQTLYDAEAAANPDWSALLQGHNLSGEETAQMDAEIAAADAILVASTFVRRTFVESNVPEVKLEVIPLGAEISPDITRSDSNVIPDQTQPLQILFAGQVNQRKGIGYLVDALARIDGARYAVRWVGPIDPSARKALSDLGFTDTTGPVSRQQMQECIKAADVVVLPSLIEGFGLTAIEAMAAGRVVIVSQNTFAEDVITPGVNGMIVKPADSVELQRALEWCINNRETLPKIGAAASLRAQDFTWRRYGERAALTVIRRLNQHRHANPI